MAVSFNVPKSPKRDIFVIDNFQGVDFTNTETSVDENKSPNAENMVRLVPGKVRKRTGYKTKVIFSDGTDINRVVKSTDDYVEVDLSSMGDTPETGVTLATFYEIIPAGEVRARFEVIAKGHFQFCSYPNPGQPGWEFNYEEETYRNFRAWSTYNDPTQELRVYRIGDPQDDESLKIRRCIYCTKSSEQPQNMKWTPAPEDSGGKYVKRTKIDPIYGCHILKTYDANRVVNVNRVLNTSDSYETFTPDDTDFLHIYDIANYIYANSDRSIETTLYIEFDYISDASCSLRAAFHTFNKKIEDTNGAEEHYSTYFKCGGYQPPDVSIKADSGTANVQIKNFSIMYQKNNDYTWTPAPEDNGGNFHIEDVYDTLPNNYALNDSYYYTDDSSSLVATANIPIGSSTPGKYLIGLGRISFDLETSTSETVSKIIVRILNSSTSHPVCYEEEFSNNIAQHFDLYIGSYYTDRYFETLQVEFQLASNDATCLALAQNISVKEIRPRSDYTIFSKDYMYHVGNALYLYSTASDKIDLVYSNMNQARSQSWQLNDKLILLDGKNVFLYEFGGTPKDITSGIGYIPTITIGKTPGANYRASGTPYESLNMIQRAFKEQFCVTSTTANEADFYLSFNNLDSSYGSGLIVEVLDGNGNWVKQTNNVDYYQYFSSGYVHFLPGHLPGASVVTGQDNVRITAYRTVDGYADRVKKCTIGALFGVGGAADRLFLSGNPDHPNWDFYSGQFDPTYFPDTGYSVLGSASSAIVGYAIVNNYLATFKDEYDPAQNVIIREGDLVTNPNTNTSEPAFKIINTLQGNGVVAPYSFAYLQTEPLFLTRSGIYAITPQDITGERYAQSRSFYLNGKLTKENDLDEAVAVIHDDQYVLAINQKLYILDGLQPLRTDKSAPYATRQYAGFYCTNIPSSCIWTDDQALWIGTYSGRVCRFDNDIEALSSYNDDGEPIYCCWETPDLDGRLFYKNKTFRYFAIRIMNALRTSCKLSSKKLGHWTEIKEDKASGTIFDFELVDFERFSFNTDTSAKVVHTKIRVKKVDKAQFRIENSEKNEPFGLFDLALEYVESGNYKG